MSKKYEQLRTIVNKILYPDGVPIESGVEIDRLDEYDNFDEMFSLHQDRETGQLFGNTNDSSCIDWSNIYNELNKDGWCEEDAWKYKILGKPLSLQDILRAMDGRKRGCGYAKGCCFIRHDGVLFQWEKFTKGGAGHHGVMPIGEGVELDLSKPISEQSQEVLEALIDLLN
ncbi:MAG: hypothetical protein JRL30_25920 [Deltaproteobacteria bacterium]|nr:hypothetical protein [Deltaproteobacteria bacterium]